MMTESFEVRGLRFDVNHQVLNSTSAQLRTLSFKPQTVLSLLRFRILPNLQLGFLACPELVEG